MVELTICDSIRTGREVYNTLHRIQGGLKVIIPFVGDQVKVCQAFGFEILSGYAPPYTSKAKSRIPKLWCQAKPKTKSLDI